VVPALMVLGEAAEEEEDAGAGKNPIV
jgi:hypothetical protein